MIHLMIFKLQPKFFIGLIIDMEADMQVNAFQPISLYITMEFF